MAKNTKHSASSLDIPREEPDNLRKHHIAYYVGSEEMERLDGFNEWIIDLFEDELSDNTKYYAYGFHDVIGDDPPYQKTFWIEVPCDSFLPEEKLFLATLTWGMKRRYHLDYNIHRHHNRTANISNKYYYDGNGIKQPYYEVNMYENDRLIESRPLKGKSIHYAEDVVENWENGLIKIEGK